MVAQAEKVADGREDRVGVVVVRFGHGRTDGGRGGGGGTGSACRMAMWAIASRSAR